MLFEKRTKRAVRIAWAILGVLIIISMIFLYSPVFLS